LPTFLPYFSSPILHYSPDDDDDNDNDDNDGGGGGGDHGERDPAQQIKSRIPSTPSFTIIPGGTYSHVSYVRVYANCRLRRIWFGENDPKEKVPWEFELYSA